MKYFPALLFLLTLASCSSEKECPELVQNQKATADQKAEIKTTKENAKQNFKKVEFQAADGLTVVGNYYEVNPNAPIIVLCHQARFNKFEYAAIVPKLTQMQFNCLAIDQRSGGPISTYQNETMNNAQRSGKSTEFLDAEQDILAAVDWAAGQSGQPVILWGSSYSSTLAIYIGMGNEKVKAFIAFSPGNYFAEKKGDLSTMLPNCSKSYFITSTKYENLHVKQFMSNVKLKENQVVFVPTTEGYHGSRALWPGQEEGQQYWDALSLFLNTIR